MNKSYLFLLGLFLFVLFSWVGGAATCNGTGNVINSTTISDNCFLDKNQVYTMSGETFYLNGTSSQGAIRFFNNVTLNGNSSTIIGNQSSGLIGLFTNSQDNITINDIKLINYSIAVSYESGASVNNITINNLYVQDSSTGVRFKFFSNQNMSNLRLLNTFLNNSPISFTVNGLNNLNNLTIDNLTLLNSNSGLKSVRFLNLTNSNFLNSSITLTNITNANIISTISSGNGVIFSYNFNVLGEYTNNTYFYNNLMNNTQYGIILHNEISNSIIYLNNFSGVDYGIGSIAGLNCNVSRNIERGIGQNYENNIIFDGYWSGIRVINSTGNCYIEDNSFSQLINGIQIQKANNIFIRRNNFSSIPYNLRQQTIAGSPQTPWNNQTSPMCTINLEPLFHSWLGGGLENGRNNITDYRYFSVINATIIDNIFDGNEQCFIKSQNVNNLTHNLNDYYIKDIHFPTLFYDRQTYYINNSYNYLRWSNNQSEGDLVFFNYIQGNKLHGGAKIYKTYKYLINLNDTLTFTDAEYNLTNALIYFSNNSVACSNINSCDGNINITLSPNNYSYVLDNFNLTEGISRQNSPLWFAQTSLTAQGKTWNIASNITSIQNVTTILNTGGTIKCSNIRTITITPNNLTPYQSTSHTCVDEGHLQINDANYEQSSSSNQISITLFAVDQGICGSTLTSFATYPALIGFIGVVFFLGLAVMLIVGYAKVKSSEPINGTDIGIMIVSLIVIAILIIIGIVGIETLCSVGVVS